jgi:lysozyme
MIVGIDSSHVAGNRNPSWVAAKAAGISFAILRCGWGSAPDRAFAREWPRLREAGLVRGAYLFLRFATRGKRAPEPAEQAEAMCDTLGELDGTDLPPVLDVEFPHERKSTGLSAEAALERVLLAHRVLRRRYRVAPIVYTSARVWRDDLRNLPAPELEDSPLWAVRYPFRSGPARRDAALFEAGALDPRVPPPWRDAGNWWIHQYQGDAVGFPGFNGKVDMNRFQPMIKGASGARVRWVQRRLAGVTPTGKFDETTEKAVRAFQQQGCLVVDGVIGPRTFARLCWTPPRELVG